jgi:DNA polymerase-3 subunit beta
MELTLLHSELTNALELVSRITSKHPTLPVLQCVLLEAKGSDITIQATNLELSVMVPLSGTVVSEGVIAIPAITFLQSIQFVSGSDITLRTEGDTLQIETTTSNTSIKLFAADEFPNLQQITDVPLQIKGRLFAEGIKSVAFAASQTSIKPELGSVFIQQSQSDTLTFVATDSFRLMERTVSQPGLQFETSLMVPQKNALELARVCDLKSDDPKLGISDSQCALRWSDGTYIASRLVTGTFPDYEQIIPKEFVTTVDILKADFQQSTKKTNIFLNKFRQVALVIGEQSLTVSAQNADVGQTTDTINAAVDGEELSLNFNQQYLVESLQHFVGDTLELRFAGIGRPLVISPKGSATVRYLVMPMNR